MIRLLPLLALLLLVACQLNTGPPAAEGTRIVPATATLPLAPVDPTVVIQPTPGAVELRIWGPAELSPQASTDVASVFDGQRLAFQAEAVDISLAYEPKAESGTASLAAYLTTASAVAPGILPDVIIFPTSELEALAESQLLVTLDPILTRELRADLYPFAMRDMRVSGNWLAVPLTVEIEHAAMRNGATRRPPETLQALGESNAPRWLFAAQGYADGEMGNALLIQLIALHGAIPAPSDLPDVPALETLARAFQEAADRGNIPRTVLNLGDEGELYRRLENRQADFIESGSRAFLTQRAGGADVTFGALPTASGVPVTVAEGYAVAITSTNPQRQEAAALWLQWLLDARRLAEWNQMVNGLPATRAGVAETIEDGEYELLVNQLMDNAWLRPGGAAWRDYARTVQEQFRALLQEQIDPGEFAEALSGN
jgi:ABC-type glycerol-3-phosphate transport system substrate-binding protein